MNAATQTPVTSAALECWIADRFGTQHLHVRASADADWTKARQTRHPGGVAIKSSLRTR